MICTIGVHIFFWPGEEQEHVTDMFLDIRLCIQKTNRIIIFHLKSSMSDISSAFSFVLVSQDKVSCSSAANLQVCY